MGIEKPGKRIATQRLPSVNADGQLNPARATQLSGVPQDPQGAFDTREPPVAGLNGGLILQIHRFRTCFADTFVELELQGRHLLEAQTFEGNLG